MNIETWNKKYESIKACREYLRSNLFSAEFALVGGSFDSFFARATGKHGAEALCQVIAHTVSYKRADMRLLPATLNWAAGVKLFTHYDTKSPFFSEFIIDMNPAVLNAMAERIMKMEKRPLSGADGPAG